MRLQMTSFENYINETFAQEDKVLLNIRKALSEAGLAGINVGPYEGKLLQLLIMLSGAKKIVELGTLYGYSTLWMARALPEDGELHTFDIKEDRQKEAKSLLSEDPSSKMISFHCGNGLELLPHIEKQGPFDLVFIDADKGGYLDYLDWAEANVRPGGLIIGDNTFLFGNVVDGVEPQNQKVSKKTVEKMRRFNQRLADPKKYDSILIPTAEGMTVGRLR